ncbi:MAG: helix-turn-helix transcriptional regulator [Bacteroidota bacterium]
MTEDLKKYDFKEGLPIEFEIVNLKKVYQEHKDIVTIAHRTSFYHILWFKEGSPLHMVDFETVKIDPNSILFLNKNVVHRFDKSGGFDGVAIIFTDDFFCRTTADTKFLYNSILFHDLLSVSKISMTEKASQFEHIFSLMMAELTTPNDKSQGVILKNLLHNFLLLSERERRSQGFKEIKNDANLEHVMLFKDLLENDFRSHKKVSYYAEKLLVTPKRLNRATSTVLGLTPKEMIKDRVLLEAKRLLAYTNDSVKSIGYSLGYDEPTNFIKSFRKNTDSTPIEFREKFFSA